VRLRRTGLWALGAAVAAVAAVLAAAGVAVLTVGAEPATGGGVRDRLVSAVRGVEPDGGAREALAAVRAGRTKHAVALLRDLHADGPPHLQARLANLLGVLVLMTGEGTRPQAEAKRLFERALRTDPDLEDAKFNLELLLSQEQGTGRPPPSGGKRARSQVQRGSSGGGAAGY
jgi:hypothetical protein